MGNFADDKLSKDAVRTSAGPAFRHASDHRIEDLTNAAEDLAARDQMPFKEALNILSGQSRPPYGSPKSKR